MPICKYEAWSHGGKICFGSFDTEREASDELWKQDSLGFVAFIYSDLHLKHKETK